MVIPTKNINLKFFFFFCALFFKIGANEIIPYKLFEFFDQDKNFKRPEYIVPNNCKYICLRTKFSNNSLIEENEITHSINYYLSTPKKENYPIVILIGGSIDLSSLKQSWSIIDIHRFYLQEIMEIGCGLITVEKLGINDASYNEKLIFDHYTRSQILFDHEALINNLLQNPPPGWNGKIILWGISEGGYIAQKIAEKYQNDVKLLLLWASFLDIKNDPHFYWESIQEFYNQFKETSIKNKIVYYYYDTLSYCYDWYSYLFPQKNIKTIRKKIKKNIPLHKKDFDILESFILQNKNIKNNFIFGIPYQYWKDLFQLSPFNINTFSQNIPIYTLIGENDTITKKYSQAYQAEINQKLSQYYPMIIPNTPHQIRKNPESIKLTIQIIQKHIE